MERLSRLKLVVFDVEGVFTDDRTWENSQGELRRYFSVRDTMGVRALRKAGYRVIALSSEMSKEVAAHVSYVGVDDFVPGCGDKVEAIRNIIARHGVAVEDVAFITNDANARVLVEAVGFGVSLATSQESLQRASRFVTSRAAGDGAVLEVCNLILQHAQVSPRPERAAQRPAEL